MKSRCVVLTAVVSVSNVLVDGARSVSVSASGIDSSGRRCSTDAGASGDAALAPMPGRSTSTLGDALAIYIATSNADPVTAPFEAERSALAARSSLVEGVIRMFDRLMRVTTACALAGMLAACANPFGGQDPNSSELRDLLEEHPEAPVVLPAGSDINVLLVEGTATDSNGRVRSVDLRFGRDKQLADSVTLCMLTPDAATDGITSTCDTELFETDGVRVFGSSDGGALQAELAALAWSRADAATLDR